MRFGLAQFHLSFTIESKNVIVYIIEFSVVLMESVRGTIIDEILRNINSA